MNYVPISFKSDYSLLKSLLRVSDIVNYASELGSDYVGILDENPYAIMDFYEKCYSKALKCIFGMIVKVGASKIYLYIKNYEGYKSLIKINNLISEGLTFDDVAKYNAGLICVLPYESYNLIGRFKPLFKVYLGYKNEYELENAKRIDKNCLFINEISYFKKEDAPFFKILSMIDGRDYKGEEDYLLSATEFDLGTIEEFKNEIDLSFNFENRYIPKFCKTKEESEKLLYSLARRGLERRLNGRVPDVYKKRLDYEFNVIKNMGFVDYFLIVFDYVKFAKKNDIYVGPGRGSAAGALVSYTLGITDIDPIKYDLLFERFLNPERITMPDIDIDFEDVRRGDVINYVREKYGENCVSLIVAYGTFGSRQAIRDVGKIMGVDQDVVGELSKMLDAKKSLKENASNPDVISFVKDKSLDKLYKISMKFEGLKKNTTIHAAGVIISDTPLLEIIPTFKTGDGILTGFTMGYLEKLGLLKMDFLAVRDLTIIHNTVNVVKSKHPNFDLKNIPLNDAKTYRLLTQADTDTVFQFKTSGMKNFLRKLQPENYDDLVAAIALFRPGPMQNIDEFIARRKGQKNVSYLHPDLVEILSSTYGIIIYQEQIMQILVKMGGYSFAEADLIRRAMSKKKKDVMVNEKERFISRSIERGYEANLAGEVYDLILRFADYGFNKSHSVAYALIGYQMAYLKANYTDLFQLNNLNMNIGSEANTKDVIEDAKARGLVIVRPDVNTSQKEYVISEGKIILPLTCIKNISSMQSKVINEASPFDDYFDFFKKTFGKGINRSAIETLIKAGALDSFGVSKNTLLSNIDSAITYIELIGSLDESLIMKPDLEKSNLEDEEYSELDIFGFYISGHPASKFTSREIIKLKNISKYMERRIIIVVLVEKIKVINTKKGEKMAFLTVADETRSMDAVIFPKNNSLIEELEVDSLYKLRVQVSKRNDEVQLVVDEKLSIE